MFSEFPPQAVAVTVEVTTFVVELLVAMRCVEFVVFSNDHAQLAKADSSTRMQSPLERKTNLA